MPRSDRGKLVKLTPDILQRAKELKQANPSRSIPHIINMLSSELGYKLEIAPSTLWRHLSKMGLGGRTTLPKSGFKRWSTAAPNDIWQSDVNYGPYIPDPGNPDIKRRTYLIAFLDDYSRLITHAEYFFAESVYSLEICFKKALLRKGVPKQVYVDNGAVFQSHVFHQACAELGIRHISAKPYSPEGKGKLERFWRTLNDDFVVELHTDPVQTLEELNKKLWAWLEEVYHARTHSSTNMTPVERFMQGNIKLIEHPEILNDLFLWRATRKVDKTSCISFEGRRYQLEPGLEGQKIEIRYDPTNLDKVQIWKEKRRFPDAVILTEDMLTIPRERKPVETKPAFYLESLFNQNEERKRFTLSPLKMAKEDDYV